MVRKSKPLPLNVKTRMLREIIFRNHEYFSKNYNFQKLVCSIRVIEDVERALHAYKEAKWPSGQGMRYLRFYGLFQAVLVLLDAVDHLKEVITGKKIKWKEDAFDMYQIRQFRHELVGHPAETESRFGKGKLKTKWTSQQFIISPVDKWSICYMQVVNNNIKTIREHRIDIQGDVFRPVVEFCLENVGELVTHVKSKVSFARGR